MSNDELIDIVMHPSLVPDFKEWLRSRGLRLAGPVSHTIGQQDVGQGASFYIIWPRKDPRTSLTERDDYREKDPASSSRGPLDY